jgi:hypothetical protein
MAVVAVAFCDSIPRDGFEFLLGHRMSWQSINNSSEVPKVNAAILIRF